MSPGTIGATGEDQASPPSPRANPRPRLAVVDRDPGFLQVLSNRLRMLGWDLRTLPGPASPEALVAMRLNALLVDLAVIGPGSWEYLERICSRLPGLSVIICTGPSSVAQRVRGLRVGADAWVTKPCHPEELICVVEAAIRRHRRNEMPPLEDCTRVGEIVIRPDLYQAYAGETSLELTAREFEILNLLTQSDRVLRREEIYERVWGYAMAHGDRSVDVFVRKLRQKLRAGSPQWSYIHTHFGVGYRFSPEPDLQTPGSHTPGFPQAPGAGADPSDDPVPDRLLDELASSGAPAR
ncbi:MAG TPA: response regulator transcription factor [Solirubrobacteraceae bacterium]|nr:response regulator transcription factor [Solirubrobacteraceae bacterium]